MASPLKKGIDSIRTNVQALTSLPVKSKARKKAILTITKKRNVTRVDAKFINSLAIAKSLAKKKK